MSLGRRICRICREVGKNMLSIPLTCMEYEKGVSSMRPVKTEWRIALH